MKQYTCASLFCGAGGLDYGFEKAGFKTIWANDMNADACRTFSLWNSDCEVICDKIQNIPSEKIPNVDILLGGFPCQGFSLAGPRKLNDTRNSLYKEYVRIVKDKQPKMFVGENVKGLLSMGEGAVLTAIVEEFASCGYLVLFRLLNAKNYGVPQDRERLILVGIRQDLFNKPFEFPEPENEILNLSFLATLPSASPDEICEESFSSRYMSRNRKRKFDEVSFTIPATAKQVPLHPSSDDMKKVGKDVWEFGKFYRRLSYKEAALIQSFPADFQFTGNLNSKYQQIGNAVPPELAFRIAKKIYEYIEDLEEKNEKTQNSGN